MRWITVGPADQPGTSIVLLPPAVDPGITDDERRTIAEMMAKGTYGGILLATADLDGTFEQAPGQRRRDRAGADRAAVRRARLRRPRPRRQPDPHPAAALSVRGLVASSPPPTGRCSPTGVPAADPRLRGLVPRRRDELRRGGLARHRARAAGDRGAVGRRRGGRVHAAGRRRRAGVRPPAAPGAGQAAAARRQRRARRVSRRRPACLARRAAHAAALRRAARRLVAAARVGQRGQVHPAGRAAA